MRTSRHFVTAALFASVALSSVATAQDFSTTAIKPSAVPRSGSIAGTYPAGGAETRYYFSADLKAGGLASHISYMGAPDSTKTLEFSLLNASGRDVDSYYIKSFEKNHEATRTFSIDNSGTYAVRVTVQGAETTRFKAEFGGNALAAK